MKNNGVVFLVVVAIWIDRNTDARTVKKDEHKDISGLFNPYENTNFRYVHSVEPRRNSQKYSQKSNPTTTQRPFISYWQNIMRNVRVPVPSITWNITNPLANLFNTEQELQELPQNNDYYNINNQLRHKTKKRRKHPNKRHRKHKKPIVQTFEGEQQLQTEVDEENQAQQQTLQSQYSINDKISDPNGPMYFYDPNTDAYYAVQRVRAMGSYIEGTLYNPRLITKNQQQNEYESAETSEHENDETESPTTVENMENEDEQENNINSNEAVNEKELKNMAPNDNVKISQANTDKDEETVRNILGTFMRDDQFNRQIQRRTKLKKTNNSKNKFIKSKPRQQPYYYFLLDVN